MGVGSVYITSGRDVESKSGGVSGFESVRKCRTKCAIAMVFLS